MKERKIFGGPARVAVAGAILFQLTAACAPLPRFDSDTSNRQVALAEGRDPLLESVRTWAKNITVFEGCRLAAVEVNGEIGLFMVREEDGNLTPIYKVNGGVDFANPIYRLREVDENGVFLPDKEGELAILIIPDRSIDEKGIIIRVEDRTYPLVIPEGMKPKQGLNIFFNENKGFSEFSDAESGEIVALYDPLTGHFLKGGPEDIFEKVQ